MKSVERPNYEDDFEESVTDAAPMQTADVTTAKPITSEPGIEATTAKAVSTEPLADVTSTKPIAPNVPSSSLPVLQSEISSTKSPLKEDAKLKKSMAMMRRGRGDKKMLKNHHDRLKRLAKRFLGIDLDNTSRSSEVSGLSANRLNSGDVSSK